MTPEEFARRLASKRKEIAEMVHTRAPRIVGVKATNFFRENYRKGGWKDGGFHKWRITRRQMSGEPGAANNYGPLLSSRNRLFHAIRHTAGDASVTIHNDTPYAAIHNEGGEVSPRITPKMRKYFWAMYYKAGGKEGGDVADKYKWMAVNKPEDGRLHIKIPQRKFIYDSQDVRALVVQILKDETRKILIS